MQTLTSVRRRGWYGQIASLPLSSFLSLFWFLCQGHRSHCASDLDHCGLKRVVPLKEVPFGGLNDVPLNFGGKIPPKLKFWGRE